MAVPEPRCDSHGSCGAIVILSLLLCVLMEGFQPSASRSAMAGEEIMTLSQKIKDAQLIFYGIVTNIKYGMSKSGPGPDESVPLTYVTYRIEEALKGRSADGRSLTLRLLGGQTPDGRYLEVSHTPQFQVGDRDLLFIRTDPPTGCPLVDCEKGRFRITETGVYGEDGRPVIGMRDGTFFYGNGTDEVSGPLSVEQIKVAIKEEIQRLHQMEDLHALEPVQSADPEKSESLPTQPDSLPPTVTAPPARDTGPTIEEDRLESEALEGNRGNPVLNEKK